MNAPQMGLPTKRRTKISALASGDAAITAPWWWPAVHDELAPQILSLANAMSSSEAAAAQRVWAMVGLMVNRRFPTDALQIVFPELTVLDVEPWKLRDALVVALKDSREAVLARAALDHLGVAAQEGSLPRLPTRAARRTQPGDWHAVFSRSTLGHEAFFVRGSHRSHSGFKSYESRKAHPHFRAILQVCERYGLIRESFSTGSPVNASTYEDYSAFLDGGLMSKAGDYLVGHHGAWILGRETLRFLCFELDLTQPPWPKGAGSAPAHSDLVGRLLIQLATELVRLHERIKEFERFEKPRRARGTAPTTG